MKLPLSSICYCGSKPSRWMKEDFGVVAAALQRTYPAVDEVHGFLVENGLRDALRGNKPTQKRGARQIVDPTIRMFCGVAIGETPLMKSFRVVTISGGKVYGNPESLLQLQDWDDDWAEKDDLETSIGCALSELEVATADASDLAKVAGSRPWESRTVPKKRTTENKHGEPVVKRRRDEGKKPATCAGCGKKFLSKSQTFVNSIVHGDCINCPGCGAFKAKYD